MTRLVSVLALSVLLVPAVDHASSQAKVKVGPYAEAKSGRREPARRHKQNRRFWMPGSSHWMSPPSPVAPR